MELLGKKRVESRHVTLRVKEHFRHCTPAEAVWLRILMQHQRSLNEGLSIG